MVERPIPEYLLDQLIGYEKVKASNKGERFDPKKVKKTNLDYRYSSEELRSIAKHLMIIAETRK